MKYIQQFWVPPSGGMMGWREVYPLNIQKINAII